MSGTWQRLRSLDRRWLYLGALLVTVAGTLWPPRLLPQPGPGTRAAFALAERLQPGQAAFLWIEYGLGSRQELDPMLAAVLRHLTARGALIVLAARSPESSQIAQEVMTQVAARRPAYREGYGRTWVNLGYRPAPDVALRAATSDLAAAYNGVDYEGRPLAAMPLLRRLTALDARHFALAYTFDSGDGFAAMIYYVGAPTGLPVAVGAISMEVPVLQPYLAAGQLAAVIGGARGAAEYEALAGQPERAAAMVGASALAAVYVLAVVALGNATAWLGEGRGRRP
jgi:hypothetical protein